MWAKIAFIFAMGWSVATSFKIPPGPGSIGHKLEKRMARPDWKPNPPSGGGTAGYVYAEAVPQLGGCVTCGCPTCGFRNLKVAPKRGHRKPVKDNMGNASSMPSQPKKEAQKELEIELMIEPEK